MATLLKKDYQYNNVLWEEIIQRVQEIIRNEYNISPYIAPSLNRKTPSPFRIWSSSHITKTLYTGGWHKGYTISVNHYLKTEDSERFYKKLYQESERLYQLFFNNQGTKTNKLLGFFGARPNGIQILQEGDYFKIEVLFICEVFRSDDAVYFVTAPSSVRSVKRAIESPYNFWSLDFDGTDDYIDAGNPLNLNLDVDSITLSAWINYTGKPTAGNYFPIIYLRDKDLATDRIALQVTWASGAASSTIGIAAYDGTLYSAGYGNFHVDADNVYNDNKWHHVVGISTQGVLSLYIDGVYQETSATTTMHIVANLGGLKIGDIHTSTPNYKGLISDVAIFNSVLSSSEIESMYNNGQPILLTENQGSYKSSGDLVAYYRMGSGSGDVRNSTFTRSTINWINDQTSNTFGSELITSQSNWVLTDSDEWDTVFTGTSSSFTSKNCGDPDTADAKAYFNDASDRALIATNGLPSGAYRISFSIATTGTFPLRACRLVWYYTGSATRIYNITEEGDYEIDEIIASNNNPHFQFLASQNGQNITISNISCKKYSNNPGKMVNFDSLDFKTNVPQIYDKALFSNSLVFDGTDDYIDISSIGDLVGEFTWSLWFKVSDEASNRRILGNTSALNTLYITPSENIYAKIANGTLLTSNATVSTTAWNHLVYTRDGDNKCKFYLNGTEVGINDGTGSFVTGGIVRTGTLDINYIGRDSNEYASMTVSDVGLYSEAVDSTNVTAMYNSGKPIDLTCDAGNYNNANNMVGYWKMGDGYLDVLPTNTTAGTIMDQVTPIAGEGNIGTTVNMNASAQSISVPE